MGGLFRATKGLAEGKSEMKNVVITFLVVGVGVLAIAFGIGVHNTMPDYAGVFLANNSKTYVPLPCFRQWMNRSPGYDEGELSTAGDARKRGYRVAEGCQQFLVGVEQSIGSSFLRDQGFLSPTREWWDQPYRTDAGMVYPKPQ